MSDYKIHMLVYLVISISLTLILDEYIQPAIPLEMILLSLAIGAVYSILPDIDIPSSIMRRLVERLALFAIIASILGYIITQNVLLLCIAAALALFLLTLWYLKHRGFFHSLAAGIILAAPLALLSPVLAVYAFLGFAVHLAVDGKIFHLI